MSWKKLDVSVLISGIIFVICFAVFSASIKLNLWIYLSVLGIWLICYGVFCIRDRIKKLLIQ